MPKRVRQIERVSPNADTTKDVKYVSSKAKRKKNNKNTEFHMLQIPCKYKIIILFRWNGWNWKHCWSVSRKTTRQKTLANDKLQKGLAYGKNLNNANNFGVYFSSFFFKWRRCLWNSMFCVNIKLDIVCTRITRDKFCFNFNISQLIKILLQIFYSANNIPFD